MINKFSGKRILLVGATGVLGRCYAEAISKLEVKQHSWPYPNTKQSLIHEHEMTWGDEYEDKT